MPPNKIYKYEPMSAQALTNLKSQVVYFSSPLNFNDPFDCATELKYRDPHEDELPFMLDFIRKESANNPGVPNIDDMPKESVMRVASTLIKLLLKDSKKELFKSKGVCCFSENNDNLLMWSHYASSAKGFCLEFDTSCDPFKGVWKVDYPEKPPKLDYNKIATQGRKYLINSLLCTKSTAWSYEEEWRAIHKETNKVFHYKSPALTGVYFGSETTNEFMEIIRLILQGQNPNAKFYKATRSTDSYKLIFKEVEYIPHGWVETNSKQKSG